MAASTTLPVCAPVAVQQHLPQLSGRQKLAGQQVASWPAVLAAAQQRAAPVSSAHPAALRQPLGPDHLTPVLLARSARSAVCRQAVQQQAGRQAGRHGCYCAPSACAVLHATHLMRACLVSCVASCWMDPISRLPSSVSSRCGRPRITIRTRRRAFRAVLSTWAGFSEPSLRSCCSLHLKTPATCTACI
jgi:hypothetical protein